MSAHTIYTIGYSGYARPDFIKALMGSGVNALIDTRYAPYSRRFPEYNKEALHRALRENGIYYKNYSREFGVRLPDPQYYPNGYFDFEVFARSALFRGGVKKLMGAMARGYTFALMCSEKDPVKCHRAILVARAFDGAGCSVVHLGPEGAQTQRDIERRLVEQYFPDRGQLSLLAAPMSEAEYTAAAYRKKNAEIGWTLEQDRET